MHSLQSSTLEVQPVSVTVSTVPFHGEVLEAVQEGGTVWVSVRRVCDCLGVSSQGQILKLRKASWACLNEMLLQVSGQGRSLTMIDLDSLPLRLATIKEGKVRAEVRPKLIQFQREAHRVLAEHFLGRRQPRSAMPVERRVLKEIYESLLTAVNQFGDLLGVNSATETVSIEPVEERRLTLVEYCRLNSIETDWPSRVRLAANIRAYCNRHGCSLSPKKAGRQEYPTKLLDAFFAQIFD